MSHHREGSNFIFLKTHHQASLELAQPAAIAKQRALAIDDDLIVCQRLSIPPPPPKKKTTLNTIFTL